MAERVLLGMSGGVDSSAAAILLLRQGYDVTGVTLRLWSEADGQGGACCSIDDVADARQVAARLGIRHYVFNFQETFRQEVVEPFLAARRAGQTPNPCILCNQRTKFESLLGRARAMGFDHVATGHYVRTATDPASGRRLLLRGLDPARDQSYFLYGLSQEQLAHVLFPVGSWRKADLRALAAEAGLCTSAKPDSQDICFVGADGLEAFLRRQGAAGPAGDFVGSDGRTLGRHQGIGCYTVGQRRGLHLACGERVYVSTIDAAAAKVHVGSDADLHRAGLVAEDLRLTAEPAGAGFEPFRCQARIRSQGRLAEALVSPLPEAGRVRVDFTEPQRAIAPGQAVVFYEGDVVLGGARIVEALGTR